LIILQTLLRTHILNPPAAVDRSVLKIKKKQMTHDLLKTLSKFLLILLLVIPAAHSQESTEAQKKSFTKYLLFRKNLVVAKSESWMLLSEIRKLGAVEKWSSVKQKEELLEADLIFKSLSKPVRNFASYETSELENEINLLSESKNKITAARSEIKRKMGIHQQIKDQIKLCRKHNQEAYNKTKQLLEIRKSIEGFYLRKYGSNFPQEGISVITKHLETAQLLADISKMNFEVIGLEKVEAAGFSAVNEEPYNPESLLQNLKEIDERLREITKQSIKDIAADSRLQTAVISLSVN
jgi:hypothetical protein